MRKVAPFIVVVAASCLAVIALAQPDATAQPDTPQPESPAPFVADTAQLTRDSSDFRRVVHTSHHLQLVLMTLQVGEDIGTEVHPDVDQCLFIVEGVGRAVLDGEPYELTSNSVVCVPAGTEHDIENTGAVPMRLFTVYAPPQHAPGTVHATRDDAQRAEESP